MIDRYAGMAQTLSDLDYEPFPNVLAAVPELAGRRPGCTLGCTNREGRPLTWEPRDRLPTL
jgi:hypothetical protein